MSAHSQHSLTFASAVDRHYVVPWSVMIASYRKHNPAIPTEGMILHYDLTNDDLTYLQRVAERFRIDLTIIKMPSYPFKMFQTRRRASLRARRTMSPVAYTKAFIDRYLPDTLERVVVIDADIVVAGDMGELLAMCPHHPVAAVPNLPRRHHHQFNSGFMLVDLTAWRRMKIADAAERFLFHYADALHSHDQHVLNLLFRNQWTRMDLKWNWMEDYHRFKEKAKAFSVTDIERAREDPIIIHYAVASDKPWHKRSKHPRANLYRAQRAELRHLWRNLSLLDPQVKWGAR